MSPLPSPPSPTVSAIYAAYEAASDSGWREHLGASLIGAGYERAVWYAFRWATRARHTGRLLRLFETGNLAEARFVADLRRIGATVLDLDPETGRRWRLRDASGHLGGSMDAVAMRQAALSRRDREAGCAAHLYIPDLVPGEQVDAGEDRAGHRLADGTTWRDGVPA